MTLLNTRSRETAATSRRKLHVNHFNPCGVGGEEDITDHRPNWCPRNSNYGSWDLGEKEDHSKKQSQQN